MSNDHTVRWVDGGREPVRDANPHYPHGVVIRMARMDEKVCSVELGYPARRCGHYEITCNRCKLRVAVTTAGRPDDPRAVVLRCKDNGPGRSLYKVEAAGKPQ